MYQKRLPLTYICNVFIVFSLNFPFTDSFFILSSHQFREEETRKTMEGIVGDFEREKQEMHKYDRQVCGLTLMHHMMK